MLDTVAVVRDTICMTQTRNFENADSLNVGDRVWAVTEIATVDLVDSFDNVTVKYANGEYRTLHATDLAASA